MERVELIDGQDGDSEWGGFCEGRRAHDALQDMLDGPGAQARFRATAEQLLFTPKLPIDAVVDAIAERIDEGRTQLEREPWPAVGVDPHHPVGEGSEDLGNLLDLLGDTPANDDESPSPVTDAPPTWIEITVVDGRGEPAAGHAYRLHLPDGTVREGRLSETGVIRFDDVDPGLCTLELPTADPAEWAPGAIAA